MAWLPWSIISIGGTFWAWKEGKLHTIARTWANYNENSFFNSSQQNNQQNNQPQQLQYHTPPSIILQAPQSRQWGMTSLIASTAVFTLAGYYYYIYHHGTKKVITKVEETSLKTQDMIKENDLNNEQRFSILEQKNEERSDNLQTEIRSEVRTGFDVVQNQLYLLTQVAVKTLTTLAKGMGTVDDGFNDQQEHLLNYSNKAQETMDHIASPDYKNEIKEKNNLDVRADIAEQKKILLAKSRNKRNNNNNNNDNYDINEQLDPISYENSSYNKFMTSKTFSNNTIGNYGEGEGEEEEVEKEKKKIKKKKNNNNNNNNNNNLWYKYIIIKPSYTLKLISGQYYEYIKPLGFIGDQITEHKKESIMIIGGTSLLYIINKMYNKRYHQNNIQYQTVVQ